MNLIADIAEMASKGVTAARMAVELELKHGVQVSEAWLEHIMGADGFHAALAQARAKLASVVDAVEGKVEEIAAEPDALVKDVIAKEDGLAQAEGGGDSVNNAPDAKVEVKEEPVPSAPEPKAEPQQGDAQ